MSNLLKGLKERVGKGSRPVVLASVPAIQNENYAHLCKQGYDWLGLSLKT